MNEKAGQGNAATQRRAHKCTTKYNKILSSISIIFSLPSSNWRNIQITLARIANFYHISSEKSFPRACKTFLHTGRQSALKIGSNNLLHCRLACIYIPRRKIKLYQIYMRLYTEKRGRLGKRRLSGKCPPPFASTTNLS